jgi:hypothetical protein
MKIRTNVNVIQIVKYGTKLSDALTSGPMDLINGIF